MASVVFLKSFGSIPRLHKPCQIDALAGEIAGALKVTSRRLSVVDRNDQICKIVGRKLVEIHAGGIHEPEEISKSAAKTARPLRINAVSSATAAAPVLLGGHHLPVVRPVRIRL
jgi:hypothetical protein